MSEDSKEIRDVITTASGEPFKSKSSAQQAMTKLGLEPTDYVIAPDRVTGGYNIVSTEYLINGYSLGTEKIAPRKAMQYSRVEFLPRQGQVGSRNVELFVQGKGLIIKRGQVVIVPDSYLEVADHTTHKVRQRSEDGRWLEEEQTVYPYRKLESNIPEEEYLNSIPKDCTIL